MYVGLIHNKINFIPLFGFVSVYEYILGCVYIYFEYVSVRLFKKYCVLWPIITCRLFIIYVSVINVVQLFVAF